MAILKKGYADFLRACKVLGCTEYDTDEPRGAACWDAAYTEFAGAIDPYSAAWALKRAMRGARGIERPDEAGEEAARDE